MPRVRVSVPDELLKAATAKAEQLGKSLDEVYAEAIERYVDENKNASGSLPSRFVIPRSSPEIGIEVPEALFQRADKIAKRLGRKRNLMYAEALVAHVAPQAVADSTLDRGH